MRTIGARFLLPFALLAVALSLFILHRTYLAARDHTTTLANREAALILNFDLAIRDYAQEKIRPVMEQLAGEDAFIPETMSTTFISRNIFEKVQEKLPEYRLRFPSDNPLNPANTATPDERKLIAYFRENPRAGEKTEEIAIDGNRYQVRIAPRFAEPACLRCHGDPKDAPAGLTERYGTQSGFHWVVGDVVGLDAVAIPVEALHANLAAAMIRESVFLSAGLVLLFASVALLFGRVVTRRVAAMASHFHSIAASPNAAAMTALPVSGNDEIGVLGNAFNTLIERLRTAQSSLEQRVAERTAELTRANEELQQEIAERKRAEDDLLKSRKMQTEVINSIPQAVFWKDRNGAFLGCNEIFLRTTRISSPEHLVGRTDYDMPWPREESDVYRADDREVMESRRPKRHIVEPLQRADGVRMWVDTTKVPLLDANGEVYGVLGVYEDITERKRHEEAFAELHQRYAAILAEIPDIVMEVNANKVYTWANPAGLTFFGNDVLGKEASEYFFCEQNTYGLVQPLFNGDGDTFYVESWQRRRDGEARLLAWWCRALRDAEGRVVGALSSARDVTDRERAEQALRDSEERYRALFDAVTDAIFVHEIAEDGMPGHFLAVNEIACKRLGYTLEEMLDMEVGNIDAPESAVDVQALLRQLQAGEDVLFEQLHATKDGRRIPVEIHAQSFLFRGRKAILSVIRDISDRKHAEEERRRFEAQVQQAQKLESLGVLAGGIAHDFNNMLMAIMGNADLALQDVSNVSPARPMLEEIEHTAHRAAELCRQMLAYSGKGRFLIQPIGLSELVEEMGHMLEVSTSKKATIRYNLASDLPAIEADATQIRQVVMNLIINASEAIGEKSGAISVVTDRIDCDRHYLSETQLDQDLKEGDYVFLEVSDTGCGMDEQTIKRIFDPFFTTKFTGRGLGLAAVIGIVRGHKGAIRVFSEPGRGTTFRVLFPAIGAEAASAVVHEADAGWRAKGIVLLVDDEEVVRSIGQRMLERLGMTVLTAADGREALEVFKKHRVDIRCVVLDLTMPRMDGEETFIALRKIAPDLPVIMSSGYDEQEVVSRFSGKGLAGFIQKPYRLSGLATVLRTVLEDAES